jgi:hypothetical protein
VLTAVGLDYQLPLQADEVCDERAEAMLPPEFQS